MKSIEELEKLYKELCEASDAGQVFTLENAGGPALEMLFMVRREDKFPAIMLKFNPEKALKAKTE